MVSTALVVSPVVVSTFMVLAVVLCSRSPAEATGGATAWGPASDSGSRRDRKHDGLVSPARHSGVSAVECSLWFFVLLLLGNEKVL